MELTWRERLIHEPEWYEFPRWPLADIQHLSPENRRRYNKNLRVVAGVLEGCSLKDVAHTLNLSPSWVSQLMTRCLGGREDAPPALTQGLIPHKRLARSTRKRPLGTLTATAGDRCAFEFVLTQAPGLEDFLLKQIRMAVNRNRRGQNLNPGSLHAQFIAYLESQNWPRNTYPFTTTSRGYESIRRFLKRTVTQLRMPKQPNRVILPQAAPVFAFEEIQIDEAHIDCHGAAAVVLHGQMTPLRLGRISLLLARDSGTGCYLAATIALTAHASASDVLALLEQLIQSWEPLTLTAPGLTYAAEAGFPSALDESFCRPTFGIIRLDNALSHLSHQVRRMICDHLGATCNFGLPKNPKGRALIEQAFRRLNVDIHRFPSTSGSHPTDPVREPSKLKKTPPYVSLRALEEAVSVLLTEFNLRPLANQGAVTPLEQMRFQMTDHFLPLRATAIGPGLQPFERMKTASVRKGLRTELPRINFEGCQYVGPALNNAELINQTVIIIFDIRDIRQLQVSTPDGQRLGVILAPKTWQRFAHSLALRKRINRLIREDVLSRRDPLGGFFNYTMAHRHLPKEALTLVQLSNDKTRDDIAASGNQTHHNNISPRDDPALEAKLKSLPDWDAQMAKNRR
jgi:putative transposase